MASIIVDNAVIAQASATLGLTPEQLVAWYKANHETIKQIRLYIQTRKVTEPEFIENYAIEGQVLDATLVQQTLTLLESGGLILRMET